MSAAILLMFVCLIAGAAIGIWWGYETGVKDTEKRWSDAVARAEDRRKYPT